MTGTCAGCDGALETGWVACPHCGRPLAGQVSSEKLVRVVTKVGVELLEAGLMEARARAEEDGNAARAAQMELARTLAHDVAPKIADAVTTYLYQKQVLETSGRAPPALKGPSRR
jgi:hypothetical protein